MTRYWLLPDGANSAVINSDQMQRQGIHPLRCVYLGRFDAAGPAAVMAGKKIKSEAKWGEPAWVLAHNVRIACDRRQSKRWRLSEQELDLLIGGEVLSVKDGLGKFSVRYSKL